MASCFVCGPLVKGTHRRWLVTGYSDGTFVSRRSFGASHREYTGLRTVCNACALSIDAQARQSEFWSGVGFFAVVGFIAFIFLLGHYEEQAKAEAAKPVVLSQAVQQERQLARIDAAIAEHDNKLAMKRAGFN